MARHPHLQRPDDGSRIAALLLLAWLHIAHTVVVAQTAIPPMAAASTATVKSTAPRYGLVIGNSAYREVSFLPNVLNDLDDMCAVLRRLTFQTTCLANLQTREAFIEAIRNHAARVPVGAVSVVHYSGHAVQVGGENYLIPTAVSAADPRGWMAQFISLSELFHAAEQARPGFQLVVLDACRDNPDASQDSRKPTMAAPTPVSERSSSLSAPAPPSSDSNRDGLRLILRTLRSAGRIASYGVAAVRDAPANTLVLFATGAGAPAFDGSGERNGPLTKHVVLQIEQPRQRLEDAVKNVIQGVGDDTERRYQLRQSPALYGTFAGEFCFNGCPVVVTPEQVEMERRRATQLERQRAAEAALELGRAEEQRRRANAVVPTF